MCPTRKCLQRRTVTACREPAGRSAQVRSSASNSAASADGTRGAPRAAAMAPRSPAGSLRARRATCARRGSGTWERGRAGSAVPDRAARPTSFTARRRQAYMPSCKGPREQGQRIGLVSHACKNRTSSMSVVQNQRHGACSYTNDVHKAIDCVQSPRTCVQTQPKQCHAGARRHQCPLFHKMLCT